MHFSHIGRNADVFEENGESKPFAEHTIVTGYRTSLSPYRMNPIKAELPKKK